MKPGSRKTPPWGGVDRVLKLAWAKVKRETESWLDRYVRETSDGRLLASENHEDVFEGSRHFLALIPPPRELNNSEAILSR